MKIKTINQISVRDWDELIESTYGKRYSFQQQDGCKDKGVEIINTDERQAYDFEAESIPYVVNGEEMGVSFQTWLNTSMEDTSKHFDPKLTWENRIFWARNFYPDANMLAVDLCKKGLLNEGEYEIKIDW